MLLTRLIGSSSIEPKLKATSKADALQVLTQLLFRRRRLEGTAAALRQIMGREAIESTGIGRGIALPHVRVAGLDDLACVVGRVCWGLDFNAPEKQPVHLIFLVCYPPAQQIIFLNFIAGLVELLRGDGPPQTILKARFAGEIFQIIESH